MKQTPVLKDYLSLALEQSEVCLWQLDYNGQLMHIWDPDNMVSLFAHNGNSFSMSLEDFLNEYCIAEDAAQIKSRLERAFEINAPFQVEHRVYTKHSDRWIWVHSFGVTRTMRDGSKRFYGVMHNIDERKRYPKSMGQGELGMERIRIMLDYMPLACTFWDGKDIQPVDCNQEALRLFGLQNKQQYLVHFYDLSPEIQPDGEHSKSSITEGIKSVKKVGFKKFEWMHQTLSGEPIPSEITLLNIKRGGKDIVIGYTRDLREAKCMLALQEETSRRTSLMADSMPVSCGFWDSDLKPIDCNDETVRMFGLTSKEDYLNNFDSLSPEFQPNGERSADYAKKLVRRAFEQGRFSTEWLHRDTQDNYIPTKISFVPTVLSGEPTVLSYTSDLREIKAAEHARREADERTQIMLDAMPLCCNFWDQNYQNIDCNDEAVRMFELANKEEYLENFATLSPKYQPNGKLSEKMVREKITRAFKSGFERFEWMHQKLNGELIPAEITLVRAKHSSGPIIAGYTRDLREVKAALEAIYKTQEELREARDLAQTSAKNKGEFLASMSHEIRTPMNAILGMLHLLLHSEMTEAQRDYLRKAEHSATLLLRVINDILDFSKIEAGKIEMERIDFNFKSLPFGVRDIVFNRLAEKDLSLDINIDESVPDILNGDPVRLEQVILNLVNNAIKFTERGGITINITRERAPTGLVKLLFSIADTGIGMSEKQVAKLFTPFSQADSSTSRKYGGTGLGLVISRSMIELMGGKIWCESKLGQGSAFNFVIFLELPKGEARADNGPVQPPGDEDAANLAGLKILLAEDNEINQLIATELLTMKGAKVDVASNGLEAIAAIEKSDYDAVLMDIQMPEMDGLSATRKLRKNPRFEKLPIIAMTAHAMSGDREQSLSSGMNDHITKPIDPPLLYATLLKWLPEKTDETHTR